MSKESQTTCPPMSCGEAWIKYFDEEHLVEGSSTGNMVDDMQSAFDAGWLAAMKANQAIGDGTYTGDEE